MNRAVDGEFRGKIGLLEGFELELYSFSSKRGQMPSGEVELDAAGREGWIIWLGAEPRRLSQH